MRTLFLSFILTLLWGVSAVAEENQDSLAWALEHYQVKAGDKPHLAAVEHYLSEITTIAADFIQVAPSGEVSAGKFYFERPGKLRMEYAPPVPILLVASAGTLIYYDRDLQQVTHIPLAGTLVGFIAREKVRFDESVKIVDFTRRPGSLRVTLVQAKRPRDGLLTLEFSDTPLKLRNMVVTDAAGQITTVSLNNAQFGVALEEDLFDFRDPRTKHPNLPK